MLPCILPNLRQHGRLVYRNEPSSWRDGGGNAPGSGTCALLAGIQLASLLPAAAQFFAREAGAGMLTRSSGPRVGLVCLRTAHWLRVADLRPGAECGTVCPVRATTRPEMSLLLSRRGGA